MTKEQRLRKEADIKRIQAGMSRIASARKEIKSLKSSGVFTEKDNMKSLIKRDWVERGWIKEGDYIHPTLLTTSITDVLKQMPSVAKARTIISTTNLEAQKREIGSINKTYMKKMVNASLILYKAATNDADRLAINLGITIDQLAEEIGTSVFNLRNNNNWSSEVYTDPENGESFDFQFNYSGSHWIKV